MLKPILITGEGKSHINMQQEEYKAQVNSLLPF